MAKTKSSKNANASDPNWDDDGNRISHSRTVTMGVAFEDILSTGVLIERCTDQNACDQRFSFKQDNWNALLKWAKKKFS